MPCQMSVLGRLSVKYMALCLSLLRKRYNKRSISRNHHKYIFLFLTASLPSSYLVVEWGGSGVGVGEARPAGVEAQTLGEWLNGWMPPLVRYQGLERGRWRERLGRSVDISFSFFLFLVPSLSLSLPPLSFLPFVISFLTNLYFF